MRHSLTMAHVSGLATTTHVRAARLSRPSAVFGWWHERKFVTAIDDFAHALRSVSQPEVDKASSDQIRDMGTHVDAIINDVEVFIARHGNSSLKRVEHDRHLVRRIYELRESYEKLARRVTADPGMTDLRWKVKLDVANRNKS